jgi:Putative abortive phage resistance protein AbiGi, antitoxin
MAEIKETLSSNTLFHFTNSAERLISILKHEFKPRYCLEDVGYIIPEHFGNDELAIPMVCFCDIPLSKIKYHLSFYGNFGIGLSKEWGVRNNISPLTYINKQSAYMTFLSNILTASFDGHNKETPNGKLLDSVRLNALNLIRYYKPYEGKFWRNGAYLEKVRFYDEREWRYVPEVEINSSNDNLRFWINKKDYLDEIYRSDLNERLSEKYKLQFEPNDIKYIIVETEAQIPSIIRAVEQIKGKYDKETIKVLLTRIVSKEQIIEDY